MRAFPLPGASVCAAALSFTSLALAADPPEPRFRAVTLDDKVQIGYGVAIADVDGDGLPDILLADKKQFRWYRNPGKEKSSDPAAWQRYVIAENLTQNDNVCIAAQDIDGDGKCEIAVGAEWNPGDTVNSGAVFYLIPPGDRTAKWEPVKLPAEPTTHRMRWIKLAAGEGPQNWGLVVVPLHGRGNKNGEGAGVRVLLYHPPAQLNDPKGEWKTDLIDDSMHMTHNFDVVPPERSGTPSSILFLAGKEGLATLRPIEGGWKRMLVDFKDESNPAFNGAGEVRLMQLSGVAKASFVTVEPMHGNQLVYCRPDPSTVPPRVVRTLLTDQLIEGHALAAADFLGTGSDQILVGWRGSAKTPQPTGLKLFTPLDQQGEKWRQSSVDENTMACEDLRVADLNGDGKPDIIASGRSTHNLVLYLNETAK